MSLEAHGKTTTITTKNKTKKATTTLMESYPGITDCFPPLEDKLIAFSVHFQPLLTLLIPEGKQLWKTMPFQGRAVSELYQYIWRKGYQATTYSCILSRREVSLLMHVGNYD